MRTSSARHRAWVGVFAQVAVALALLLGVVPLADGKAGARYTSPNYGYSVLYDDATWNPLFDSFPYAQSDNVGAFPQDSLALGTESGSDLHVIGRTAYGGDPGACVEGFTQEMVRAEQVVDVKPLQDASGAEIRGRTAAGGDYAAVTVTNESTQSWDWHVECYTVQPGESVVIFWYKDLHSRYESGMRLAREIIDTLAISNAGAPAQLTVYTSPTYGHSFSYDPAVWTVELEHADTGPGRNDELVISTDNVSAPYTSNLHILGTSIFGGDAVACVADWTENIGAGYETFVDENGDPVVSESVRGGEFTSLVDADGNVVYIECLPSADGKSVVVLRLYTVEAEFARAFGVARTVFASVEGVRTTELTVGEIVFATEVDPDYAPATVVDRIPADASVIYAVVEVTNVPAGSVFAAEWEINGEDRPEFDGQMTAGAALAGPIWAWFQLQRTSAAQWEQGDYSVSIFVDGKPMRTATIATG